MSMKPTLIWNQAGFIAQVKKDLAMNGEIAGEFLVSEARKNLLAISDPTWGRAYRREVVSRLITSEVEVKTNEVDIVLGVKKSASGAHHGFYIELGSATAPPHPFLRPAIFHNGAALVRLLEGS